MNSVDLVRQRLHNQHLTATEPPFATPHDIVRWMGAVQAQDYPGAIWALGLRAPALSEAAIDQAFADGTILRTHVMRPTWHFVCPEDLRWLLALTAPRVHAQMAGAYRQSELDAAVLARSQVLLVGALQGGQQLTRTELGAILSRAGIACDDLLRLGRLLMAAELDGVICSGARRGKQFTYALLDERAPASAALERDQALTELVRRYFTSHGPATVQDFVWWSGLTAADARSGLALLGAGLDQAEIDGQRYWFAPAPAIAAGPTPTAHLLPNYDEYIVGYTDRRAAFDAEQITATLPRDNLLFNHTIMLDGRIVGVWRRTLSKRAVNVTLQLFRALTDTQHAAVVAAAERYGVFLGLPVRLS